MLPRLFFAISVMFVVTVVLLCARLPHDPLDHQALHGPMRRAAVATSTETALRYENVTFYRGATRYPKPIELSCREIALQSRQVFESPLARGWVKEVSVAEARGGAVRFVLKRPVSAAMRDDFVESLEREVGLVRQLRPSPHVMYFYGACRERAVAALAVEGPLLSWAAVARSPVRWSARLVLAREFVQLLLFLERKMMVHCDWKPDQVGVATLKPHMRDRSWIEAERTYLRVKLVDLKSLRTYSKGWGVDRGKNCSSRADCVRASACLLWQYENGHQVPDVACAKAEGHCLGLDSRTMLQASVETFLQPLLVHWAVEPVPAKLQKLLLRAGSGARRHRVDVRTFDRELSQIVAETRAVEDMQENWVDVKRVLTDVMHETLLSAGERCKSRFC